MARVYRVFDRLTGEFRAMKCAESSGEHRSFEVEALEREYAVLASLEHPRIIRVYDYGVNATGRYYTMDLLDGQDMRELAPLSVRQTCHYLRDVATSLALLHARRLIHRDLSPSNVRATPDGHCKLIDFGALAAFGISRIIVGTPPAIAPEAFRGEALDQRTDLYALGTLAYWMLTRRHAYPAIEIVDLPARWEKSPPPPSQLVSDVPPELDALVMALLRANPMSRPTTAAEVIARLEVIGELQPEDPLETERLAQSFLLNPRFIGRTFEVRSVEADVARCLQGRGGALSIRAMPGLGRTRFLEEVTMRSRLMGAAVMRTDGSAHRQTYGTARALVTNLVDTVPELVREHGGNLGELSSLELDLWSRFPTAGTSHDAAKSTAVGTSSESPSRRLPRDDATLPPSGTPGSSRRGVGLPELWLCKLSQFRPLVVVVDNVDEVDDASLGFLLSLAQLAREHALLVITSEPQRSEPRRALGLIGLREHSAHLVLAALTDTETTELVLSMFGQTANAERFSDWLYTACGGNPMHAIEICRQLVQRRVIRYAGGLWLLPSAPPEVQLPAALEEALTGRLAGLGALARELAELICLLDEPPTFELCQRLLPRVSEIAVRQRLDELALHGILFADGSGYRFSSSALRAAVLANLDMRRLRQTHEKVGVALAATAAGGHPSSRIQAGWHLIRGGQEERGADLIASVTHDQITVCQMAANLHRIGKPTEAALLAYGRHRRSIYHRMPLLSALAQAGWYEDSKWAELYGDQALDSMEAVSGLTSARWARRYLGAWLSLIFGMFLAYLRFCLTPRSERPYSFPTLMAHVLATFSSLCGVATVCLDNIRISRIVTGLEPFAILPERLTPKGFYRFCRALQGIHEQGLPESYERLGQCIERFKDPRHYPALPPEGRQIILASAIDARSSLGVLRAHAREVMADADALENTGLELYALIGSEHRYLYHLFRGELEEAANERVQVDLHAARMGGLWQVEFWESAALIAVYANMLEDVVGATRLMHHLEMAARRRPAFVVYWKLAQGAVSLLRGELGQRERWAAELELEPTRGFLGWSAATACVARTFNAAGEHQRAVDYCLRAVAGVTDADREFVILFSALDIELALARSGLGQHEAALAGIDVYLERFADCDSPLLLGLLHEARARICFKAGNLEGYSNSLGAVAHWFRSTGAPTLIAKYERLAQLGSDTTKTSAQAPIVEDAFGAQTTAKDNVSKILQGVRQRSPASNSPGGGRA